MLIKEPLNPEFPDKAERVAFRGLGEPSLPSARSCVPETRRTKFRQDRSSTLMLVDGGLVCRMSSSAVAHFEAALLQQLNADSPVQGPFAGQYLGSVA